MVYGELGRFPSDVAIKTRMIGYWGKIVTGKQVKYAPIVCINFCLNSIQKISLSLHG